MSMSRVYIRPLEATDNPALKAFVEEASTDGGKLKLSLRIKKDDVLGIIRMSYPLSYGLGAFDRDSHQLVGTVYASPARLTYGSDDRLCQTVYLHSLSILPSYRLQNIATTLMMEIISWAKSQYDLQNLLVYGSIQQKNVGSLTVCTKAGGQLLPRYLRGSVIKTTFNSLSAFTDERGGEISLSAAANPPPDRPQGLNLISNLSLSSFNKRRERFQVRRATANDLEKLVKGLNNFYRGYDLYSPFTVETLSHSLGPVQLEPDSYNINTYYVLVDSTGELHAGLEIKDSDMFYESRLLDYPLSFKLLNLALGVVPKDGVMRTRFIGLVWYNPGYLLAAKELIKHVQIDQAPYAQSLAYGFDPASPLRELYSSSPLQLSGKGHLVVFNSPKTWGQTAAMSGKSRYLASNVR